AREELSRFVASFVRPHGLGRPATPILAGAIEALGQKPAADPERAAGSLVLRWLLYPLAILMTLFPDEALRKRRKKKARERERRASPPVPAPAGAPAAARPNALLAL